MIYKEQLEQVRKGLLERKQDLAAELRKYPDGSLYILNRQDKFFYYERKLYTGADSKEPGVRSGRSVAAGTRGRIINEKRLNFEVNSTLVEIRLKCGINFNCFLTI